MDCLQDLWNCRSRKAKLRSLWDSRDKDVVTLHMFPRARTGPNPSPFPVKLETFLRMTGIKYVLDHEEPMSSKNKCPWITINGTDISDSQMAINYLTEHFGKNIESHLTKAERAVSRSMRIMIEDHFYWCTALERWVFLDQEENMAISPPYFPQWLPSCLCKYMMRQIGKEIHFQGKKAGMGRHSRQELERLGREVMTSLSDFMGEKPFLLGKEPCLADLSMFGFVTMFLILPRGTGSVYRKMLDGGEVNNLVSHHARMVERYWPDYETAKYGCKEN